MRDEGGAIHIVWRRYSGRLAALFEAFGGAIRGVYRRG